MYWHISSWKPRVRFWIIECVEVHTKTENQFGSQRTRIHANSCPDTLSQMKNHCLRLEGTKRISRKERERDRVKNGENQEIELICEQWNVCHIIKLTQWQKSIRALLLLSLCVWFLLLFRFFFLFEEFLYSMFGVSSAAFIGCISFFVCYSNKHVIERHLMCLSTECNKEMIINPQTLLTKMNRNYHKMSWFEFVSQRRRKKNW